MGVYAGVCFSATDDPGGWTRRKGAWVVRALGDRGSGLMGSVIKGQAMASSITRELGRAGKIILTFLWLILLIILISTSIIPFICTSGFLSRFYIYLAEVHPSKMSIKETFSSPTRELFAHHLSMFRRDKNTRPCSGSYYERLYM